MVADPVVTGGELSTAYVPWTASIGLVLGILVAGSVTRGGLLGGAIGAGVGLAMGNARTGIEWLPSGTGIVNWDYTAARAIVGAVPGAVLGALVGASLYDDAERRAPVGRVAALGAALGAGLSVLAPQREEEDQ